MVKGSGIPAYFMGSGIRIPASGSGSQPLRSESCENDSKYHKIWKDEGSESYNRNVESRSNFLIKKRDPN